MVGASPAAASDPYAAFGYNVQSLVRASKMFTPADWPTYLTLMADDGVRIARTDALWSTDEPSAPSGGSHTYNWTTDDRIATALLQQGIRWDAVLSGSPKWAAINPNSRFGAPQPGHYPDFAAFAAAFASRYGPGGAFWSEHPELMVLPVTTIEIWNEPNTQVHWGTTPDAAAYASLFAQSQAAVRAVDPTAQVPIGGIVWNDDVAYLQALLAALGPDVSIDAIGYHPYAPTVPGLIANVQRVRAVLDAAGRSAVPLLLNELGWPAAYDRAPAAHAVDGPVTDEARAATLALTVDGLTPSTCGIGGITIFDLVEDEQNPAFVESLMGLYRRSGARTVSGNAYRDAVARFAAAGAPGPPVGACGARGAKRTQLLPLVLGAAPAADGCHTVDVTYRDLPLEEADVRVIEPYVGSVSTDAAGKGIICPPSGGTNDGLRIQASVAGVAISNFVVCDSACHAVGVAATCATARVRFPGGRGLRRLARRGLLVRARGCAPQQGESVRLRATLTLTRGSARRLRLARHPLRIGRAHGRLAPGGRLTLRIRPPARVARALRHARTVRLVVRLYATEAGIDGPVVRALRLKR